MCAWCASLGATGINSTTVNGAAAQPAFWTDSYKGEEYGIMSLDATTWALGEGSAAEQRRSLLSNNNKEQRRRMAGAVATVEAPARPCASS